MRVLIRSSVAATVIAASTALTGAMTAVPEISPKPTVSQEVRLAASPAPGALVGAFLRNQLENCSVICPFIVQGATTVPVAAAAAPLVFVNALTTQPLLQAIGTAAASVTQPAQDAAEGIITNDLNLVLPRAQRALEVAVVEAFTIGSTALTRPGQLPRTVDTARNRFLTALNQPLGVPTLPSGATTPLQVAAVRAIEIGSAVAFQAGELLLLGAVRAANTAATTLSRTGSVPATIAATGASVAFDGHGRDNGDTDCGDHTRRQRGRRPRSGRAWRLKAGCAVSMWPDPSCRAAPPPSTTESPSRATDSADRTNR